MVHSYFERYAFVVGQENYSRFVEVMHQCVQVYIDRACSESVE